MTLGDRRKIGSSGVIEYEFNLLFDFLSYVLLISKTYLII
jgi:hypothetical protein